MAILSHNSFTINIHPRTTKWLLGYQRLPTILTQVASLLHARRRRDESLSVANLLAI
jgi:hypothetical protein